MNQVRSLRHGLAATLVTGVLVACGSGTATTGAGTDGGLGAPLPSHDRGTVKDTGTHADVVKRPDAPAQVDAGHDRHDHTP